MTASEQVNVQEGKIEMPRRLSGSLCLDFVNTIDPRHGNHTHDYLTSYAALITWCIYVDLLTDDRARQLLQAAEQQPAREAFHRACSQRGAIRHIFGEHERKTARY